MEGGYQILNLSRWNLTSTSTKIKGAYGFIENNTEHKTVLLEDLMLEGERYDAIFTTFAKASDNYVGNFVINDMIYTIIVRPNDNINIRKLDPVSENELTSIVSDEWISSKIYVAGEYVIYQGSLYRALLGSRGAWPASNPTYWQKCKVTDVDKVALQSSTQTSFAALAASVPEGYKYSMQLNITNFTDKPSGITSWFAYCDISASNMSGFVSLILTSNQGMWFGKYGGSSVTWTKID